MEPELLLEGFQQDPAAKGDPSLLFLPSFCPELLREELTASCPRSLGNVVAESPASQSSVEGRAGGRKHQVNNRHRQQGVVSAVLGAEDEAVRETTLAPRTLGSSIRIWIVT